MLPAIDTMYQALLQKDSTFEGIFLVGVKTTGIFCRPSCTARKPKKENTEYFPDTASALKKGYRPCKICRPMRPLGALPEWLEPLFKLMCDKPALKLKDHDLMVAGIDPVRVRRWFKKNYGMTFQKYQRQLVINRARAGLSDGKKTTRVAFEHGYESLSGFGQGVKKALGVAPSNLGKLTVLVSCRILTPLGPMIAMATEDGVALLEFADRPNLATQIALLLKKVDTKIIQGFNPVLRELTTELKQYFAGQRHSFDVNLELVGTAFQLRVWQTLQTVPFAQTRSYLALANQLDRPKAVRAVARANGANRLALLVPCHRIIGSDGSPTGYAGGIWRKKWLLHHESSNNQGQRQ